MRCYLCYLVIQSNLDFRFPSLLILFLNQLTLPQEQKQKPMAVEYKKECLVVPRGMDCNRKVLQEEQYGRTKDNRHATVGCECNCNFVGV